MSESVAGFAAHCQDLEITPPGRTVSAMLILLLSVLCETFLQRYDTEVCSPQDRNPRTNKSNHFTSVRLGGPVSLLGIIRSIWLRGYLEERG